MPSLPIPSPQPAPARWRTGGHAGRSAGETLLQRVIAKVQLNDESYLEDAVQTIRRELQVLVGRMEEDVLATFRERDHVLLYSSR